MPTYNRTLDDAQPPAQQSGSTPFTIANFQEAPDVSGVPGTWTTRTAITLSPVEPDVTSPLLRDLTTDAATLTSGWYRALWEKASGTLFEGGAEFFDGTGGGSGDLTTRASVREYLQKNAAETAQDPLLDNLIARASKAIHADTRRQFTPVTSTAYAFVHDGGNILSLAPYDAQSVSAVVYGSEQTSPQTLVAVTDWSLRPKPARDGVYTHLRFTGWYQPVEREVTVTGVWGFPTIPADVEYACIVTVATWLRRDVASYSQSFQIDEQRLERPEALPSAVKGMLAPYRRSL